MLEFLVASVNRRGSDNSSDNHEETTLQDLQSQLSQCAQFCTEMREVLGGLSAQNDVSKIALANDVMDARNVVSGELAILSKRLRAPSDVMAQEQDAQG